MTALDVAGAEEVPPVHHEDCSSVSEADESDEETGTFGLDDLLPVSPCLIMRPYATRQD